METVAAALAAPDPPLTAGWVVGGLVTLCFAAWNMVFSSKIRSLHLLWRWKDEFVDRYNTERLADSKEYASRAELSQLLSAMEVRIEKRLDDIKDLIEDKHGKR